MPGSTEKPISKANRVLRELLPPPLLAKVSNGRLQKVDIKSGKARTMMITGGINNVEQDQHLAKMNKVQAAWGNNKSQGGILGNDMEATYKDLFMI